MQSQPNQSIVPLGLISYRRVLSAALLLILLLGGLPHADAQASAQPCPTSGFYRLFVGGLGMVTPGEPNTVRSTPTIIGAKLGMIPAGGVFTTVEGPLCADGYTWWKVNYEGLVGWTADGSGQTAWAERLLGTFGTYTASNCPPNLPGRLTVGQPARVTPGDPNTIREYPTVQSKAVGTLSGGTVFDVIGGPFCAGGYRFWALNYDGLVGWTAEGQTNTYWLEPVGLDAMNDGCPLYAMPLEIGKISTVLVASVQMYVEPKDTSRMIWTIPQNGRVTALAGSVCFKGQRWWQVMDQSSQITGWVRETNTGEAWFINEAAYGVSWTSYACPQNLPPQLIVGRSARVTPGLPNAIRNAPGNNGSIVIGSIPAGATFSVLGGYVCNGGRAWWAINYNGIVGWTAEGEGLTRWVQVQP